MTKNVLYAIVIMLAIAILVVVVLDSDKVDFNDQTQFVKEPYVVKNGETLWHISTQFIDETVDPREWIYEVKKLNGLENEEYIFPGQTIIVYVQVN